MKKILCLFLTVILLCLCLISCAPSDKDRASIVTQLKGTWYYKASSYRSGYYIFTPDYKFAFIYFKVFSGEEEIDEVQIGTYEIGARYVVCTENDGTKHEVLYDYNKNVGKLVSIGSGFEKISDEYDLYYSAINLEK